MLWYQAWPRNPQSGTARLIEDTTAAAAGSSTISPVNDQTDCRLCVEETREVLASVLAAASSQLGLAEGVGAAPPPQPADAWLSLAIGGSHHCHPLAGKGLPLSPFVPFPCGERVPRGCWCAQEGMDITNIDSTLRAFFAKAPAWAKIEHLAQFAMRLR